MIFITGDVSDGSKNDLLLREIIGDNWKVLTGAEQPVMQITPTPSSPGYDHAKMWPAFIERVKARQAIEAEAKAKRDLEPKPAAKPKVLLSAAPNPAPSPATQEEVLQKVSSVSSAAAEGKIAIKKTFSTTVELLAFLLDNLHYMFNDMFEFMVFLIELLEIYLGPSTNPTKVYIRLSILSYITINSDTNERLRPVMGAFIVCFLFLYALFGDLGHSKSSVKEFVSRVSLDG
jgi:hypothetical protein